MPPTKPIQFRLSQRHIHILDKHGKAIGGDRTEALREAIELLDQFKKIRTAALKEAVLQDIKKQTRPHPKA